MNSTLHTTVTILVLAFVLDTEVLLSQANVQYIVADYEYSYSLRLENVTDSDEAKVPLALLHDQLGVMPQFDLQSKIFYVVTKKNVSEQTLRVFLIAHDYHVISMHKEEHNKSIHQAE